MSLQIQYYNVNHEGDSNTSLKVLHKSIKLSNDNKGDSRIGDNDNDVNVVLAMLVVITVGQANRKAIERAEEGRGP